MSGSTPVNRMFYGDNLDVLRNKITTASVDLCYIDPPFNSKRKYFQIYNNIGGEGAVDRAQAEAFTDTFTWEDRARDGYTELTTNPSGRFDPKLIDLITGLHKVLGQGSLLAYLVSMSLRVTEIHRILKPTGSFYLHCDPTASHYLKLILDAVFVSQGGDFQNEIIWRRTGAHSPGRSFGPVHDVILFYTRSAKGYTFNIVRRPYMLGHVKRRYRRQTDGRYRFTSRGNVLSGPGIVENAASGQKWRRFDVSAKGRHWAVPGFYNDQMPPEYQKMDSIGKLNALFAAGLVEDDSKSEWPIMVRYLDERDGAQLQDIWAYQPYTKGTVYDTNDGIDQDVQWFGPTDTGKSGYQTEKPEGLLERIIASSSSEGGVILDAYCGCGTTITVAQNMKRSGLG